MARLWKQVMRLIAMVSVLLAFFGVDAAKRLPSPAAVLVGVAAPPAAAPAAPVVPVVPLKHNISSCATGDVYDGAGHRVGVNAACVVDGQSLTIGMWPTRVEALAGIREFRRVHGK